MEVVGSLGSAGPRGGWLREGLTCRGARRFDLGRAALRREGTGEHWHQYGCDGEVPKGEGEGDALLDEGRDD
jgi:hypothetical protein